MIRELRKVDINKVAEIWLDTNIKTHYFISAQYWKSNFELVKELLLQATVYVYEDKQEIQGFICLLYTSPSPRDRQKSRMPSSA